MDKSFSDKNQSQRSSIKKKLDKKKIYNILTSPDDLEVFDNKTMIAQFICSNITLHTIYKSDEKFQLNFNNEAVTMYLWCGNSTPHEKILTGVGKNNSVTLKIPLALNPLLYTVKASFKFHSETSEFAFRDGTLEAFFIF